MKPAPPALTLDMEKYLGQLSDWDITEAQKAEMIRALWQLLVSFAEIGFEIHPVQRLKDQELTGNRLPDMVSLEQSVSPQFEATNPGKEDA